MLNVEGCELIDDQFFVNMITSNRSNTEDFLNEPIEERHQCIYQEEFSQLKYEDRLIFCSTCPSHSKRSSKEFHLKSLDLSGCYQITDFGLK